MTANRDATRRTPGRVLKSPLAAHSRGARGSRVPVPAAHAPTGSGRRRGSAPRHHPAGLRRLRIAIDAKVSNAPPAVLVASVSSPDEQVDFDGELRWLVAVAFSRSAPVTAATARYGDDRTRNGVSRKGQT